MKKIALAVAIALSAGLFFLTALSAAPRVSEAEAALALGEDNVAWLVENRQNGFFLFGVTPEGRLAAGRWENAPRGGRVAVTALAADAGTLYYIKNVADENDRVRRELIQYDVAEKTYRTLYTAGASAMLPVTSMTVQDGLLYLVGTQETAAQVFCLDPLGEDVVPKQVADWRGEGLLAAAWQGDTLYITSADGSVRGFRGGLAVPGPEGSCVTAISATQAGLWYYDDSTRQLYAQHGLTPEPTLEMPAGITPLAGAARSAGEMAVLATKDANALLYRVRDGKLGAGQEAKMSMAAFPAALSAHWGSPLFWLSIGGILLIFGVAVLLGAKTVAAKLISITFCCAVLAVSLLTGLLFRQTLAGYRRERMAQAGMVAAWQGASPMSRQELYQGAEPVYADGALWTVNGGEARFAQGPRGVVGARPQAVCQVESARLVEQAALAGSPQSGIVRRGGIPTAVYVMPVSLGDDTGLLAVFLEAKDLTTLEADLFYDLLGTGSLIAGGMVVAVALLVVLRMHRLRGVAEKLQAVADGDYTADDVGGRDDEIGMMQRSMQEVCLSLAIREYETASMVSSYQRFVPHGINDLLERASIAEVSCGDIADISGEVGVVTVGNRETILQALDNQGYMQFVNSCFLAIQGHAQSYGAQLLHSDFDIASVPLFFTGGAADGISFGLELMGERDQEQTQHQPRFYLLLHHTDFLYGVAGTEGQAFPFLASSELTFLTSFSDRLEGLGCKVVVTEQYQKNLPETVTLRYIGFVASRDGRYTYKLFEVLDVLSDSEKARRLQYDQKFQEGINLFYKNNFYLARNIFSSILKMCPKDGVARWYTFACEYFFNSDDPQEVCYNLFGAGE